MSSRTRLLHVASLAMVPVLWALAVAGMWWAHGSLIVSVLIGCLFLAAGTVLVAALRNSYRRSEELVRREAIQATLLNRTRVGMAVLDEAGSPTTTNDAWDDLSRRGAREAVEGMWPTLLRSSPEDNLYRQADLRCHTRAGQVWTARLTAYPLGGEHGCILEDITPLCDMEDAVRAGDMELAILHVTAAVITTTDSPDTVVPTLLEAICECTDWSLAAYWTIDPDDEALHCRHVRQKPGESYPTFAATSSEMTIKVGNGLVGRVWQSRRPAGLREPVEDGNIMRSLKAQHEGLHSAYCFPIAYDNRTYGLVELWSRHAIEPSGGFLRATSAAAAQLGARFARFDVQERTEARLRVSEQRYQLLTNVARDAIVTVDTEGNILSANASAEEMFGYGPGELTGRPLSVLIPPELRQAHLEGFQRYLATGMRHMRWERLELTAVRKDGASVLVELSLAELDEDGARTVVGLMRDVTEHRQEESALVYQALHDTLTDLPNRTLLQERLERCIVNARRQGTSVALLFMDLNRFKEVNDTFGHHCGDLLLQQVALRLQTTLRDSDTVARLGGDEFALLLPLTDELGAAHAARRVADALREPFSLSRQPLSVDASIGIALCPEHGADSGTLMRRADVAMYAAKRGTSSFAIYSAERDEASAIRLVLTNELRSAIETGGLFLHYQPIVNLRSGRAEHVEALIRWDHPERGYMPPDGFIPLAEETGLVKPLTLWVLDEVLREQAAWRERGHDVRVSVNFSACMFRDPNLVESVCSLLAERGVEPSGLQIEVTESALMLEPERAWETLSRLHDAGVWTSIDDFGAGYSSLGYLKRLPVDEIKIDKSFVLDMATNRDDASIVRSVVTLGHNLGLEVVAEGVENRRVMDMLSSMGADLAQGFFLSRPVPPAELTTWLTERNRVNASDVAREA